MAVDLRWDLLTNASANLGNSLVNAAGTIHDRREGAKDKEVVKNYLANPNDPGTLAAVAERNPDAAFKLQDHHREQLRQLKQDQRDDLSIAARLFRGVKDDAGYQAALATGHQLGIDMSDAPPTYDPGRVGQIVALGDALREPASPVKVGEGEQLVDPHTGSVIASGRPKPTRYYPVPQGGMLVPEPGAGQPAPTPAAPEGDLQAQAQAAIAAGADPVAVNQRLQQMLGGAGQQAPRPFP